MAGAGFFQFQLLFGFGEAALRLCKLRLCVPIRLFSGWQGGSHGPQFISKRGQLAACLCQRLLAGAARCLL